jgi:four helix bundle protein
MDMIVEDARNLPDRTFRFAQSVRRFVNKLPRLLSNYEDARQVVRPSGSVAANYLEAQEAVSRRDFFYRIKVSRKEARESWLWLRLIETGGDATLDRERDLLVIEAHELMLILTSIAMKDDTGEV